MITRLSGAVVAGLLSLAIGLERFANAMLLDGLRSYASTRFIVAAICTGAGGVLLAIGAITGRRRRSRRTPG